MVKEYDIVGLLKTVISEMKIEIKVIDSIDHGDGTFSIEVCDTKYMNECLIFSHNGSDYIVNSIDNNVAVIQGSPVIDSDFNLPAPLFIPDTPKGTNIELEHRKSDINRHPFIWLLEDFPTEFDLNNNNYVAKSRVRLFFLNASQEDEWLEEDFRKNCIVPMLSLCDDFIENVEDRISGKIYKFTVKNRLRFGKSSLSGDNSKKILDENLSGVELDIHIPLKDWSVKCSEC